MAYNEQLAKRIRELLQNEPDVIEKKMFGGLCFMVNGKMVAGLAKGELMLRVLDERYPEVLDMLHVREMDFTGRALKGFIYVDDEGIKTNKQLKSWIDLALEFAYKGPAPKKKKRTI